MTTFLATILVFGVLVASHEFGHFMTAKLSGVRVLEFAIGMGPKLLGFKKGETYYTLRLFPIGGYVKMDGEEEASDDPGAFCNQNPWKRLLIIVAGAAMNILIAIILYTIVFYNTGVLKPIVSEVEKNYPAYEAGIRENDKILKVNNEKISTWNEFSMFVAEGKGNDFTLQIERNSKISDIHIKPKFDQVEKRFKVGIAPTLVKCGPIESLKSGLNQTTSSIKQMLVFLGSIFKGKASVNDLGGPVAIASISGQAAKAGIWSLLGFMAFLSINLGVFNLIPFPALDGGWVIILLIEALTGKKINPNKMGIINLIGFAVLITFAIFVTYKDILRIIN